MGCQQTDDRGINTHRSIYLSMCFKELAHTIMGPESQNPQAVWQAGNSFIHLKKIPSQQHVDRALFDGTGRHQSLTKLAHTFNCYI